MYDMYKYLDFVYSMDVFNFPGVLQLPIGMHIIMLQLPMQQVKLPPIYKSMLY